MLLDVDWHWIILHALFSEFEQLVEERIQRIGACQRLEQELTSDCTFTIRDNPLRKHGLLDDLGVDSDCSLSLGEILLAIEHEVVDRIEQVSQLSIGFGHDLWEVVEHFPHEGQHSFSPLDETLDQKQNVVLK